MIEIMQSATGLTLTLGPFVSQADAKTPIEGVDLTTADSAIIFKHSAASASFSIDSATWTNMGSGYYSLAATSSMFDTLGPAKIAINDVSLILPYFLNVLVVHDNYWNAKYSTSPFMASASGGTIASVSNTVNCFATSIIGATIASVSNSVNFTIGTIASVSNPVVIYGTSAGAISASSFAAGALATSAENASAVWYATVTAHAVTNSYGLIHGGIPSATTQASVIAAIAGKAAYLPSASIASVVWNAASADYAGAGTFGGILGAMGAGADPWSSTVTAYTGTNTFGLLLGGIPSATTLASVIAGIAGKTSYLSSATVGDWTIASVTGSVYALGNNTWNKVTYQPSATVGDYTIASMTGSVYSMIASTVIGKTNYLPSITMGSWSISGVASVSGSVFGLASSIWGKAAYIPSATVENWTIASVSNSVNFTTGTIASVSNSVWWTAIRDVGSVTGNLMLNVLGNVIGTVASVSSIAVHDVGTITGSFLGTVASVSGSVNDMLDAIVAKLPTKYYLTGTNELDGDLEMASVVGVFPNDLTGTLASVSSSVLVRSNIGSMVWSVASSSFGVGGTFGGILGGLGAGADPWSSTVTAYVGTNTFGRILGGIPSATTLASDINAIVGKTFYIPSATVENWTIASVSNSVHIGMTDVGTVTGNIVGYVASVSALGVQTIASVSGSVYGMGAAIWGKTAYLPSSTVGDYTIASVTGSVYGMGLAIMGKTFYLPSITMGSWSISAVASVSIAGLVGSVSASVVDGFFEEVVEGVTTFRESQKYQNAFAAGKASVAVGSATASFRDIADSLDRIIMDLDEDGNRTTVTRNGA